MTSCQCVGIEEVFDEKTAQKELESYRKKGPDGPTQALIQALQDRGLEGMTLLDIGGGVGAVHHELLKTGVTSAIDVDASSSYLAAAQEEAKRQGHSERVTYQYGNFVETADAIERADVVTLNRVICCYDDMVSLVGLSAARTAKLYGAVYPQDTLFVKFGLWVADLFLKLSGNPFRTFVHATEEVDAILRENGLQPRFYQKSGFARLIWQVVVYERNEAA